MPFSESRTDDQLVFLGGVSSVYPTRPLRKAEISRREIFAILTTLVVLALLPQTAGWPRTDMARCSQQSSCCLSVGVLLDYSESPERPAREARATPQHSTGTAAAAQLFRTAPRFASHPPKPPRSLASSLPRTLRKTAHARATNGPRTTTRTHARGKQARTHARKIRSCAQPQASRQGHSRNINERTSAQAQPHTCTHACRIIRAHMIIHTRSHDARSHHDHPQT
jgi:hypothetical protein